MNIPKRVKVAGLWYQVIFYDDAHPWREKNLAGRADHDLLQIELTRIDRDKCVKPRQRQEEVFFHEVIHCIDNNYEIELKEKQVSCLTTGLYQVLEDNKFYG